jgi:ATP-binding cassette subfamily C protein
MSVSTEPTAARPLLPTATRAETRRALARILAPRRGLALAATAALVATAAVGLLGPALLGRIVDAVSPGRPASAVTVPALGLGVVALVAALLTALGRVLVARVGEGAVANLREQVMERATELEIDIVERAGRGDLVARLADDVRVISSAVTSVLPTLAEAGFTIVLTVGSLALLDWRFALAALCAVPVQAHTLRWYLGRSRPIFEAARVADGARAQQLVETLSGAATIRSLRLAPAQLAAVRARSGDALEYSMRSTGIITRFYGRLNLAEVIGLSSVLIVGFLLVRDGSATVGAATAAALYFHRLFGPINELLGQFATAQSAAAGLARLVGVINLPGRPDGHPPVPLADHSVAIDDVEFAYQPEHPVLSRVSLRIEPGETVALVGASGAGKSTLAKLVAGIHRPAAGGIRLGGRTHDELGAEAVGRAVVLLTQDVHIFAGPLAADLRLARPAASDDELRAALGTVGALGWVEALPDGLETVVGEGGHRLTATQAQQIALARVVLVDAPVVILDEATADAGSAGARTLEAVARRVLAGRTAVVVAHRLTQAAAADRVAVLDRGLLVEVGNHDELLASGGRYAELWEAWSARRAPASDPAA